MKKILAILVYVVFLLTIGAFLDAAVKSESLAAVVVAIFVSICLGFLMITILETLF